MLFNKKVVLLILISFIINANSSRFLIDEDNRLIADKYALDYYTSKGWNPETELTKHEFKAIIIDLLKRDEKVDSYAQNIFIKLSHFFLKDAPDKFKINELENYVNKYTFKNAIGAVGNDSNNDGIDNTNKNTTINNKEDNSNNQNNAINNKTDTHKTIEDL